jgi:hypothetical protein
MPVSTSTAPIVIAGECRVFSAILSPSLTMSVGPFTSTVTITSTCTTTTGKPTSAELLPNLWLLFVLVLAALALLLLGLTRRRRKRNSGFDPQAT